MRLRIKRILGLVLVLALLMSFPTQASGNEAINEQILETVEGMEKSTGTKEKYLLADEELLPAGSSLSDWVAITLAFAGVQEPYADYLERLEAYVTEQYQKNGVLEKFKATEYHRIALAVLALGGDPTAFGKNQDGDSVNLIADGVYNFHGETPGQQGSNGLAYALLALDAKAYEVPADAKFTREQLVQELCSMQTAEGGIALSGNSGGDVDITAMALQALAPYKEQEEVAAVIDKALEWLALQMTENGTFLLYGTESVESSAQVILALCSLGLDPQTDERFVKRGTTLLDGMENFRMENGMYMHTVEDAEEDLLASEQALLALEAIYELRTTGNRLWDFAGYVLEAAEPEAESGLLPVIAGGVMILVIGAGAAAVFSKKKKEKKAGDEQ